MYCTLHNTICLNVCSSYDTYIYRVYSVSMLLCWTRLADQVTLTRIFLHCKLGKITVQTMDLKIASHGCVLAALMTVMGWKWEYQLHMKLFLKGLAYENWQCLKVGSINRYSFKDVSPGRLVPPDFFPVVLSQDIFCLRACTSLNTECTLTWGLFWKPSGKSVEYGATKHNSWGYKFSGPQVHWFDFGSVDIFI